MQFENIFKSILTTLLGAAMMGMAFYGWYTDWLTDWQGAGAGISGFALLFMRDKLPEFIGRFANALLSKFTGDKQPPV
jgi:hypothetical protein